MGGAFIDCNQLFCQLSNYSKQEVCGMTIFNLTSRQDLQHAFDLISQMISPPTEGRTGNPKPCLLRGAMKERQDLGLSVALIKGDDGIAKCFCVTLIKNPISPFDTGRPVPATADLISSNTQPQQQPQTVLAQQPQPVAQPPAVVMGQPGVPAAPVLPGGHGTVVQHHHHQPQSVVMGAPGTVMHPGAQVMPMTQAPKDGGSTSLNSSPAYTSG